MFSDWVIESMKSKGYLLQLQVYSANRLRRTSNCGHDDSSLTSFSADRHQRSTYSINSLSQTLLAWLVPGQTSTFNRPTRSVSDFGSPGMDR